MIYELFQISDTDGTVLDISDLLKAELKGHNVRSFDTTWDDTIIAMQKQPDEGLFENLYFRQLKKISSAQATSPPVFPVTLREAGTDLL